VAKKWGVGDREVTAFTRLPSWWLGKLINVARKAGIIVQQGRRNDSHFIAGEAAEVEVFIQTRFWHFVA